MSKKKDFRYLKINGERRIVNVYMVIKDLVLVEREEGENGKYNFFLPDGIDSKDYSNILSVPVEILDIFTANKLEMDLKESILGLNDKNVKSALNGDSVEDILNS